MPQIIRSQSGQSLVQVMISMGIVALLASTFATLTSNQQRETRALSERLAANELKSFLTSIWSDGTVCAYEFSQLARQTFDPALVPTSNPPSFDFTQIHSSANAAAPLAVSIGSTASSNTPNVVINSIKVILTGGTGNFWTAEFQVGFDSSKLVRAMRNISIKTILQTTDVGSLKQVVACSLAGSSVGVPVSVSMTCPAGGWVTSCTATCPVGTHVTGGGCACGPGACILSDLTLGSSTTYVCTYTGGPNGNITSQAICL